MKNTDCQENNRNGQVSWKHIFGEALYDRLIKFPVIVATVVFFVIATRYSEPDFGLSTIVHWFISPTGFLKGLPARFDPPVIVFLVLGVLLDAVLASFYQYIKKNRQNKKIE